MAAMSSAAVEKNPSDGQNARMCARAPFCAAIQSTSDSGAALSARTVSLHRCHELSEILCASAAIAAAKALRFQSPKNHRVLIRKQLISDGRRGNDAAQRGMP